MVKVEALKEKRGYVMLGIFIVAAILTPPDAVSQCFMAVPMWVLYEIGIVFAQVLLRDKLKPRRGRRRSRTGRGRPVQQMRRARTTAQRTLQIAFLSRPI